MDLPDSHGIRGWTAKTHTNTVRESGSQVMVTPLCLNTQAHLGCFRHRAAEGVENSAASPQMCESPPSPAYPSTQLLFPLYQLVTPDPLRFENAQQKIVTALLRNFESKEGIP